jgi:type IV pilus assembly protein PilQ
VSTDIPSGSTPPAEAITITPARAAGFGAFAITNAGANYIINAAIAAAESKSIAKTISKPTIVTQNNVPGTVTQGAQVPIQTEINRTITVQYINAALTLRVTPQVTDDGFIFLDISVNNSSPGAIVPGVNPVINTQQATTQVLVPDGGTVIFGGITLTTRSKSSSHVPVLGSIPVLGNLFKSSVINESDQELLFFVSPRVLPG